MKAIENVSLRMKTTAASDAADCLISTYYYEAWCKIMTRKYQDAIDALQEVLLYIERGRKTILNKESQVSTTSIYSSKRFFSIKTTC